MSDLDDQTLEDEKVWRVQTEVRRNNQYTLQLAQVRNVLVVGRTRSGKSTVVGVLKDPVYEAEMLSLFPIKPVQGSTASLWMTKRAVSRIR